MFIVPDEQIFPSSVGVKCARCRSYGAWGKMTASFFYKHSAPLALNAPNSPATSPGTALVVFDTTTRRRETTKAAPSSQHSIGAPFYRPRQ